MSEREAMHGEIRPYPFDALDDWVHLARCAGQTDLYWAETTSAERNVINRHGGFSLAERRAKAMCATCPVRDRCLNWMYTMGEQEGIWGGTTERERKQHRHAKGCIGCLERTVVHRDLDKNGREVKRWHVYGCKPVQDRVDDLLAEMDSQAVRNGFKQGESVA